MYVHFKNQKFRIIITQKKTFIIPQKLENKIRMYIHIYTEMLN